MEILDHMYETEMDSDLDATNVQTEAEENDIDRIVEQAKELYKNNDLEKSFKLYKEAAGAGNAYAMCSLGNMYSTGTGVEQDYNKAVEWYEKAAKAGNADAIYVVSKMYYEGNRGVEQDYEKAVEWYRKAAEAGEFYGMEYLGRCYIDGTGVKADSKEALKWFTKIGAGYRTLDEIYRNKAIQGTLNSLGYDCGTPDGVLGEKTRNAVRSFRRDYGMEDSDLIDLELMKKILEVAENS